MNFDSKDFSANKVKSLSFFMNHCKNIGESDSLEIFQGFGYLLSKVLNAATEGEYKYTEIFFKLDKNKMKSIKVIKKEFITLGFQVNINVSRKAKRLILQINWE